jgi:WXXGXW repeat (2 copies)
MHIRSIRAVLFAFVVLILSSASFSQVRISVQFGPPALPVYEQPLCPGEGYIWTPGYWAWSDDDNGYFWVPGTWVLAPEAGFLWTPPWWGWEGGVFLFHEGYWGPQVGFYGGIYYGFGYFGEGFEGGRWDHDRFFYNRSVTNVNITNIHNVYNETVVNNRTVVNRVSYNGGEGGITRRPTPQEQNAEREHHIPPAAVQIQHIQAARANRELRASANQGKPPVAATAKPGEFSREAVPAREAGGAYNPPANRGGTERRAEPAGGNGNSGNGGAPPARIVHPKDIPQGERPAAPNTGNQKQDQKYQQQQEKLQQKQEQERQKLQQKQDQDHQRLTQQKANEARQQQIEQTHQQQTQQLQQRHEQQQQKLQQRQAPPSRPQPEKPNKK